MDQGKYSAFIRGDYLQQLGAVRRGRDRDQCIQEAIEYFLSLALEERRRESSAQRVRISHPADAEPDYYMWLEIVSVPDDLVEKLERSDVYIDSTKALNAAIRVWLERKEDAKGLKP